MIPSIRYRKSQIQVSRIADPRIFYDPQRIVGIVYANGLAKVHPAYQVCQTFSNLSVLLALWLFSTSNPRLEQLPRSRAGRMLTMMVYV